MVIWGIEFTVCGFQLLWSIQSGNPKITLHEEQKEEKRGKLERISIRIQPVVSQ